MRERSCRCNPKRARVSGPSLSARARPRTEVFGRDLVEELAELLDLVLLLVGDLDPDLVEQVLRAEDRRPGADGERDGVRRPGADDPVLAEHELGDVDAVPHLGDVHGLELGAEGADDLAEQVVRHRAGRPDTLLLERDRRGLDGTDPDRQVPLALRLLEQQDRLVPGQLHPDTDDSKLLHGGAPQLLARWEGAGDGDASHGTPDSGAQEVPESCLQQRRVQLSGQRRELPQLLRGARPGLLGAGPQDRRHELLDQAGLALDAALVHPQMPRLDAVPGQPRRGPRDGQVRGRVPAVGVGGEQSELHAVGQLLGLQARRAGELVGRQRRDGGLVVAVPGGRRRTERRPPGRAAAAAHRGRGPRAAP